MKPALSKALDAETTAFALLVFPLTLLAACQATLLSGHPITAVVLPAAAGIAVLALEIMRFRVRPAACHQLVASSRRAVRGQRFMI